MNQKPKRYFISGYYKEGLDGCFEPFYDNIASEDPLDEESEDNDVFVYVEGVEELQAAVNNPTHFLDIIITEYKECPSF